MEVEGVQKDAKKVSWGKEVILTYTVLDTLCYIYQ